VKSAKSPAMKPAAAVETPATTPATTPAMRPSVGGIWLGHRGSAQQRRCDCHGPSYPWPGSILA
jgi:hypothetical protein